MINENISLGGAPVVGFGDANVSISNPVISKPLIGFLVGSIGGAALGALAEKKIWTAAGAIAGGLGGMVIGAALTLQETNAASAAAAKSDAVATWTPWQRVQQISDLINVKKGQQIAMTIAGPNGTPAPPDLITQFGTQITALSTAPANLPLGNFVTYPPGSKLPSDWPADDTLGTGAYRVTADALTDAPPQAASLKFPAPDVGVIEVWVRDKSAAALPPSSPQMLTPDLTPIPDTSSASLVGPQYLTKYTTTAYQMVALPDPKRPIMLCSYVPYFAADATNLSVAETQLANMRSNHESATESLYGINGRRWIVTLKKRYFDPKTFKELPSDVLYESTNKFSVPTSPDPGVPCG